MLAGLALLCISGAAVVAQNPNLTLTPAEQAQLQEQKQALFQQMLNNPANLDVAFSYADVSARLGDNEAAVAALERMLLFNPNLPRVDLELGVLYFRMGSFEVARTYFQKALAANPPDEVKNRVNQYLGEIQTQAAPQRFTGFIFSGIQYQSDANVAPGSSAIIASTPLGPQLLSLGNQFTKKSDENLFLTGSGLYTYDLGTQNRDVIEVGGTAFINHYFRFKRLDLGLLELTAGPRFNFPEPATGVKYVTLKPYAIANEVGLGRNQYFFTYGAGGETTSTIFDDLAFRGVFEFRQKNFSDAADRPLSRGLNGNDKIVSLQFLKPLPFTSEFTFQFDFLDQSTRFSYYANKTYAGSAGYRIRFDDPTEYFHFPWETSLFVSRSWSDYQSPDPCCNVSPNLISPGTSSRLDRRWRFGLTQSIQIDPNIAIVFQFQRDIVSSNLPLYAYTSNSVLVGPQIRF